MAQKILQIPEPEAYDGYEELSYEILGRGEPAIVFVHGLGADHVEFQHQIEHFAPRHFCIALDLRGFGLSSAEGELSIRRSVKDLELLVDTLGLDRFILVGHSMGTMISYAYTVDHPERVERLVIVGGTAAISQSPFVFLGMQLLPVAGPYLLETHRRWIVKHLALNISMRSEIASPRIVDHYLGDNPRMFSGQFYDSCMHYVQDIARFDIRRRIRGIHCPVLLIHGALDPGISVNSAVAARLELPNATLRIIPTCGHSPNVESPDQVNRMMEEFIEAPISKLRR
jgi:3-oxoadipate enol-lactonase